MAEIEEIGVAEDFGIVAIKALGAPDADLVAIGKTMGASNPSPSFGAKASSFKPLSTADLKKAIGLPSDLPLTPEIFKQYQAQLFKAVGFDHVPDLNNMPLEVTNYFLDKFDLPSIPKLTPESLVNTGLQVVGLAGVTLPFPLPSKIPDDVGDVVEYALNLALQTYGPQLLGAVGAGSVVPGIGNAVAFVIAAGKMLVDFQSNSYAYSDKVNYYCRLYGDIRTNPKGDPCANKRMPPPKEAAIHSATSMLHMATLQYLYIQALVTDQEDRPREPACSGVKSGWYDKSQITQCMTNAKAFIERYYQFSKDSVDLASLPMVNHALMIYDEAQKLINKNKFFSDVVGRGRTQYTPKFREESIWIRDRLNDRKVGLEELKLDSLRIINEVTNSASKNAEGSSLRLGRLTPIIEDVADEMKNSAISTQIAGITQAGTSEGERSASAFWVKENAADFAVWYSILNKLKSAASIENARFNSFQAAKAEDARKAIASSNIAFLTQVREGIRSIKIRKSTDVEGLRKRQREIQAVIDALNAYKTSDRSVKQMVDRTIDTAKRKRNQISDEIKRRRDERNKSERKAKRKAEPSGGLSPVAKAIIGTSILGGLVYAIIRFRK